ncbi:MAG: hypothetical protein ACI4X9_04730 [Kiritimatiellia bacterium]
MQQSFWAGRQADGGFCAHLAVDGKETGALRGNAAADSDNSLLEE